MIAVCHVIDSQVRFRTLSEKLYFIAGCNEENAGLGVSYEERAKDRCLSLRRDWILHDRFRMKIVYGQYVRSQEKFPCIWLNSRCYSRFH